MTEQDPERLLTALEIAAFARVQQSAFRPLATPPAWFGRLSRDGTFPFLGDILEEAEAFWVSGQEGSRQWGPCAEVAEDGREFHYLVKALTADQHAYLVFQLDEGAERLREVLQKVRADGLDRA